MKRKYLLSALFSITLSFMSSAFGLSVYSNDFDDGTSLSGFTTIKEGSGTSISVTSGQLCISPEPKIGEGIVSLHTSNFSEPYESVLNNNAGLISWSFNISNLDGTYNNFFSVTLAGSDLDSSNFRETSYYFAGGGYVGDRIVLAKHGEGVPETFLINIEDGLSTLPSKGSFRITYNPQNNIWNLYGNVGDSYVDPQNVQNLMGSTVDSSYTNMNLPYISFSSGADGTVYFDNFNVEVIPEPATLALLALGGLALRKRK